MRNRTRTRFILGYKKNNVFCRDKKNSDQQVVYMFDLDGTLVNSEPLIAKALITVLRDKKFSIDLSFDQAYDYVCGHADQYVFDMLKKNHNLQEESREIFLITFKEQIKKMIQTVKADDWLIAPTVNLLKSLVAENKKVCIVSGSSCDVINMALEKMGLKNSVPYIGCENYKNSKPDPEPYLLAAHDIFKLDPTDFYRVVIFEDSLAGVEAGVAAQMHVIGLQHSSLKVQLVTAGAHCVLLTSEFGAENQRKNNNFSLSKWLETYLESPCYRQFVSDYQKNKITARL